MPSKQGYIVRGMKRRPMGLAAGIRQQASQLPQMYAQRQNREFQDAQIGLGERKLALEEKGMSMKAQQFKKSMALQKEAAETAKGGMMLKGGLAIGKGMYSEGMFKPGMERMKAGYNKMIGTKQAAAIGTEDPSLTVGKDYPGQQTSFNQFTGGEWKSGATGGIAGGMMGAGLAKTAGARKKWQVALAGTGGGMAATWMAGGGGNPFSMALGGALGGGLGMLIG